MSVLGEHLTTSEAHRELLCGQRHRLLGPYGPVDFKQRSILRTLLTVFLPSQKLLLGAYSSFKPQHISHFMLSALSFLNRKVKYEDMWDNLGGNQIVTDTLLSKQLWWGQKVLVSCVPRWS